MTPAPRFPASPPSQKSTWPRPPGHIRTDRYLFHGLDMAVSSDADPFLETVKHSLRHFLNPTPPGSGPDLHLAFFSRPDLRHIPIRHTFNTEPVSFSGELKYYLEDECLYTTIPGQSAVMCQLRGKWATGYIAPGLLRDEWLIFQMIFYPVLAELLKVHGIFNVHAAAVADRRGRAALITAPTGSGKSTTLVNLVRSGYKFLSDDITLLRRRGAALTVLGLPEPVSLCPDALEYFPELDFLRSRPRKCANFKHNFRLEGTYADSLALSARPACILFPRLERDKPTSLLPLARSQALSLLIPQSLVVANKTVVRRHLQILTQLVQNCRCFQLRLGKGSHEVPRLVDSLVFD